MILCFLLQINVYMSFMVPEHMQSILTVIGAFKFIVNFSPRCNTFEVFK